MYVNIYIVDPILKKNMIFVWFCFLSRSWYHVLPVPCTFCVKWLHVIILWLLLSHINSHCKNDHDLEILITRKIVVIKQNVDFRQDMFLNAYKTSRAYSQAQWLDVIHFDNRTTTCVIEMTGRYCSNETNFTELLRHKK